MKVFKIIVSLFICSLLSNCSGGETCYNCVLNATAIDVCESTYQNLQTPTPVNSLDEYINEIAKTGFVCTEISE